MRSLRTTIIAGAVLVTVHGLGNAKNIGTGFGETLWTLVTARQAGTGGLSLEDPWRRERILELSSIVLDSGLRWYEIGYQGGLTKALRVGGEVFVFSAPGIEATSEWPDGTYAGSNGEVDVQEYGGRVIAQLSLFNVRGWRIALTGRGSGVLQVFPDGSEAGTGLEIGAQGQIRPARTKAIMAWAWYGPLGSGAGRRFTNQGTLGCSYLSVQPESFSGYGTGYAAGAEARVLGEGLFHASLGGVFWVGKPAARGVTYFLRAGVQEAVESAQMWQPHGGLGVLWKNYKGAGVQFDYAMTPRGDMGNFHYATVSYRFGVPDLGR